MKFYSSNLAGLIHLPFMPELFDSLQQTLLKMSDSVPHSLTVTTKFAGCGFLEARTAAHDSVNINL